MSDLTGRTALVTGASRGIGRAIARRLAADGARVAVHYGRDETAAKETVASIGDGAFAVRADLAAPDAVDTLFAGLHDEFDHLDILVNNAGIGRSSDLEHITTEEFDRLFAVNVRAPLFIARRALPLMSTGGRIVNISSGVTRIAMPEIIGYTMSKGAVEVFTRQLAQQLGPRGITVNTVSPGIVDTDNTAWIHDTPETFAAVESYSALGRVGQPSDIADVVAFLASEESRWVTGDLIDATGGSCL